jgi:hypothetical protein
MRRSTLIGLTRKNADFSWSRQMANIGMAIFAVWLTIGLGLYLTNSDLLSPAKLLHVRALVFFLALYFGPDQLSVYLL